MPEHYECVGIVERFIPSIGVVGVKVLNNKIKQGDRIAFELPVEFQEQDIKSLEIGNEPVEEAKEGFLAGIKTNLSKEQLRKESASFG